MKGLLSCERWQQIILFFISLLLSLGDSGRLKLYGDFLYILARSIPEADG